jgi:histidinol phosphatase-like PHP family hydrolase
VCDGVMVVVVVVVSKGKTLCIASSNGRCILQNRIVSPAGERGLRAAFVTTRLEQTLLVSYVFR